MRISRHRFEIPGEARAYFQRRLFNFGIDSQRVMGGSDGLCQRLSWQYATGIGLGAEGDSMTRDRASISPIKDPAKRFAVIEAVEPL